MEVKPRSEYDLQTLLLLSVSDLNEGVEGLLLVVLRDDLRQQGVLALGQLDEGADAVDVGVDLDVQNVVLP